MRDKLDSWCKACRALARMARYEKNRAAENARAWVLRKARMHEDADVRAAIAESKARTACRPEARRSARLAGSRYAKANRSKVTAHTARYRARKFNATPAWVDLQEIGSVYAEASRLTRETGTAHHVDHIVPLRGRNVCGLHVPWNLQVIPAVENRRKGNRHNS
ncbi:MAG TPA: hypothetical protein VGH23_16190 [Rhizomicrobium sp.]